MELVVFLFGVAVGLVRRPRAPFVWTWPERSFGVEPTPLLKALAGKGWKWAAALARDLELPAGQSAGRTLARMLRSGLIVVRREGGRVLVRELPRISPLPVYR